MQIPNYSKIKQQYKLIYLWKLFQEKCEITFIFFNLDLFSLHQARHLDVSLFFSDSIISFSFMKMSTFVINFKKKQQQQQKE